MSNTGATIQFVSSASENKIEQCTPSDFFFWVHEEDEAACELDEERS